MIPFLIVSAVRDPTSTAPRTSKIVPRTIACRYETDRDETEVAHALATSSAGQGERQDISCSQSLTGTVVVRVEQREEGADREDVVVLAENGHFVECETVGECV